MYIPPIFTTCFFVVTDPTMKKAPKSAPSTVRLAVPAHKARTPPSRTIFLNASIPDSVETVTRVLIHSKGVPPVKSDAIRNAEPRAIFLKAAFAFYKEGIGTSIKKMISLPTLEKNTNNKMAETRI